MAPTAHRPRRHWSIYKIESTDAHAYPKLISLSKIGRITKIQGGIPTEVKNRPPDLV